MTDKPMDVERTLRELIAKWREGKVRVGTSDMQTHGARWMVTLCADELEGVVREALREPGTRTFEEWWAKIVDNGKSHVPKDLARTAWNAALSSKQEPPAPARCPHCKGTKESPMPLSGVGARCFDVFHDSAAPPVEGKQEPTTPLNESAKEARKFRPDLTLVKPGAEAAPPVVCKVCSAILEIVDGEHICGLTASEAYSLGWRRGNNVAAAGESTELRAALQHASDWLEAIFASEHPEAKNILCRTNPRVDAGLDSIKAPLAASQERSATEPAGKRGKRCT
jgi:hypothetical protein